MMFLANTCIGTVNISEIQQEGIEPWDLSKNIYIYLSLYICIIIYIYIYLETQLILLEVESVPNNSRSQPGHSFSPESACLTPKVCTQCLKTVSISWVSPTLHRSWHRTASQPSFVLLDLPVSPYRPGSANFGEVPKTKAWSGMFKARFVPRAPLLSWREIFGGQWSSLQSLSIQVCNCPSLIPIDR
jgi:hypothetical protein